MRFSVVIPVYNAAATLRECLDSVAAQSYRGFEVVLVNDGSTDESPEVFEDWKKDNPDIEARLVSQDNQGLGAARNTGVREAGSEYIAFLDADDRWHPQKLARAGDLLIQGHCDLCYHDARTFGLGKSRSRKAFPVKDVKELLTKGNPIIPSAVVGKRQIFLDFPFSTDPAFHGAEDLHLWIRLLAAGKTFCYQHESLLYYRESGGMSTRLEEHLRHVEKVLEEALSEGWIDQKLKAAALRRKDYEAARFYHKRGEHTEAARYYRQSGFKDAKTGLLSWINRLHWRL